MQEISLSEFKSALEARSKNTIFVDVRTEVEYISEHIEGVKNIPLDTIKDELDELNSYQKVYLHCQSGARCRKAFEQIQDDLGDSLVFVFSGGIEAWKEAKYPLDKNHKALPIMRQVMIAGGSLILIGFGLFLLGYAAGVYLMAFVGAGLFFAGITGWCGMAKVLGLMPWNQAPK